MDERSGDTLPPDVAALAELLGARFDLGKGVAGGLELHFSDQGNLRKWKRLEEGGRDSLDRFNEEEGGTSG